MFNGIIERMTKVVAVADGPGFRRLTLARHWDDVRDGESIAVNGACLTIAEIGEGVVGFDVITETLEKTNLGRLQQSDEVNVERAIRVGDRIDGHFVQGHVDCTGLLISRESTAGESRLFIEAPDAILKYLVPKGSIAVDGVSLTIAAVSGNVFQVAIIPTTMKLTTLGEMESGWNVNLEADILSKQIVHFLELRGT